jgi:hypothetical protein
LRFRRGAAVYRTFPTGGGQPHPPPKYTQDFINAIGAGGSGSSYGSSGGGSPPGLGLNYGGSSNLASQYAQSAQSRQQQSAYGK